MKAHFTLDPEAVSFPYGAADYYEIVHERILSSWKDFGILYIYSPEKFLAAIEGLPQRVRKRWKEFIQAKVVKYQILENDFSQVYSSLKTEGPAVAPFLYDHDLKLVGITPHSQSDFGSSVEKFFQVKHLPIEVANAEYLDQAKTFQEMKSLQRTWASIGDQTDVIWKSQFAPICLFSNHVAVVDRYAALRHIKSYGKRKSGLEYFVEKMVQSTTTRSMVIYSSFMEKPIAEYRTHLIQMLRDKAANSSIDIKLYLVNDNKLGKVAHGRYVRGGGDVITVDLGLEIFENQKIERIAQLSLTNEGSHVRDIEQSLERHALQKIHWRRGLLG